MCVRPDDRESVKSDTDNNGEIDMHTAYAYAVQLIEAGYTVHEAGDAAAIMHGLDEYQEDDMNRRLRRFFVPGASSRQLI